MRVQQLIEDDLKKCSAKHVNNSMSVARGIVVVYQRL